MGVLFSRPTYRGVSTGDTHGIYKYVNGYKPGILGAIWIHFELGREQRLLALANSYQTAPLQLMLYAKGHSHLGLCSLNSLRVTVAKPSRRLLPLPLHSVGRAEPIRGKRVNSRDFSELEITSWSDFISQQRHNGSARTVGPPPVRSHCCERALLNRSHSGWHFEQDGGQSYRCARPVPNAQATDCADKMHALPPPSNCGCGWLRYGVIRQHGINIRETIARRVIWVSSSDTGDSVLARLTRTLVAQLSSDQRNNLLFPPRALIVSGFM